MIRKTYKLKTFLQKHFFTVNKETNFYSLIKDKKDECFDNLPNRITNETEEIYHHFFQSLEKVREEEVKLNNIERIKQLDEKALKILTTLRENGISSFKLQNYYKYFVNK